MDSVLGLSLPVLQGPVYLALWSTALYATVFLVKV